MWRADSDGRDGPRINHPDCSSGEPRAPRDTQGYRLSLLLNNIRAMGKHSECLPGNTPLIELKSLSRATGCRILVKCEQLNPGGSIKDRAALWIIEQAEMSGALKPGGDG